jgi:hypothetical protein
MSELLRGNFKVKNEVEVNETVDTVTAFNNEFRKKALESIGGSMVFIEREMHFWDESKDNEGK